MDNDTWCGLEEKPREIDGGFRMIYFCIPLRSRAASKNWEDVTRVFNRTLNSVYSQTDPDFKILVACHDVPALDRQYDERVEFLISDRKTPKTKEEMLLDKGWKVSMMAKRIREAGGGYTMLVDSDDLISNRIAEYVNSHPRCNGYLSRYGYVYCEGADFMKKVGNLHKLCGSCSIVCYAAEDLPDEMPESFFDDSPVGKWIIRKPHCDIPDFLAAHGRRLSTIPFPTTVYVRNTGDNHSMMDGNDFSWKRRLYFMLKPKIRIDGEQGREFGFFPKETG